MQEKCLLLSNISLFGVTYIHLGTLSAICQKYYIRIVVSLCTFCLSKSTLAHAVQQSIPWRQSHRCVSTSHSKSILSFTLNPIISFCVESLFWLSQLSKSFLTLPTFFRRWMLLSVMSSPHYFNNSSINSAIYNPILRTYL